jgi:uncharacterized protein (DUF1778 family)
VNDETSFSSFFRLAAVSESRRALAVRTRVELDEPGWDRLMELMDRPATVPKGLRSLFSKSSVFE